MQRSLHQVLFKEVKDPEDWNTNLYDWLIDHVWERSASVAETVQRPPTEPPPAVQASEPSSSTAAVLGEHPVPEVPNN